MSNVFLPGLATSAGGSTYSNDCSMDFTFRGAGASPILLTAPSRVFRKSPLFSRLAPTRNCRWNHSCSRGVVTGTTCPVRERRAVPRIGQSCRYGSDRHGTYYGERRFLIGSRAFCLSRFASEPQLKEPACPILKRTFSICLRIGGRLMRRLPSSGIQEFKPYGIVAHHPVSLMLSTASKQSLFMRPPARVRRALSR